MTSIFLKLFQPFLGFTLNIKKPEKAPSFRYKAIITFVALVLYLAMISTPLFGVNTSDQADPFEALRVILASQRGTLGELGIGPIVTAGMIMQLLVGSQIISVDFSDPEERAAYTGTQKILSVLMTVVQAIAYLAGGAYGEPSAISPSTQAIIVLQLTLAGISIILMDEMVQKGYGLGSGISLFIAASVSFTIFRGMFDLTQVQIRGETRYNGAVLQFVQSIFAGDILERGLSRPGRDPDMVGLFATIFIFAIVIYLDSMRVEIPVQHAKYKMPYRYPLKFMYTSNIPVILVSALFANIFFISNLMDRKWGNDPGFMGALSNIIGRWEAPEGSRQKQPVSGLAAYTTPPFGFEQVVDEPFRAIVYLVLMVVLSTFFSMVWVDTAGMGPDSVARQLLQAEMVIPGFRRNEQIVARYLNNYIPYLAFLSGAAVGFLAAIADFMGAIGTGTGILLTTGIIRQYYEILAKERLAAVSPTLAGVLGIT